MLSEDEKKEAARVRQVLYRASHKEAHRQYNKTYDLEHRAERLEYFKTRRALKQKDTVAAPVYFPCNFCGTPFLRRGTRSKLGPTRLKYCSFPCLRKSRYEKERSRIKVKIETGTIDTHLYHGYGKDWPLIALDVKYRDNYTCRSRGCESNDDLVVHHIVGYLTGGTNDLENLITLCRSCHSRGHGLNVFKFKMGWPRGEAVVCKTTHMGSNPVPISIYEVYVAKQGRIIRRKLRALALHVIGNRQDLTPPQLCDLMWRIDMEAYGRNGKSITGAAYIKTESCAKPVGWDQVFTQMVSRKEIKLGAFQPA